MSKKVLLGMSGGVDSSASAILLKQKGYEVIGCTMILHDEDLEENKAVDDAKKICEKLQINHYIYDFKKEFKCRVIKDFINEYQQARTPNPCIECNKYLKFGAFIKIAKELNCDYIATGHYARVEFSEKYQKYVLKKSKEEKKDQTYFLYNINKEDIEHIIFPLQDYVKKEETRQLVEENGLEVSKKKDSQEICFIPNDDYQSFLIKYMDKKPKEGNIVLSTGEVLGKHKGLINYTVGQRKGLGISYKEPLYVVKLDIDKNEVVVGIEKELYTTNLYATDINWLVFDKVPKKIECLAKVRYRAKEAEAIVYEYEKGVKVEFKEAQRAITPGQSVVFYDKEGIVLGGGKINF